MSIDTLVNPPEALASPRFFRTAYLPIYAGALFLIFLIWAGAPFSRINFGRAWKAAGELGVLEALLIGLLVVLAAVIMQPVQSALVRLFEGAVPRWLGSPLFKRRHALRRLRMAAKLDASVAAAVRAQSDLEKELLISRAGRASVRLRTRYPAQHAVRATALGNVLAAIAGNAGRQYGLDPMVVWPHIYPLLSENLRTVVDDQRDALDSASRLSAAGVVTAIAATGLLAWNSGWWTLLAAVPLVVAALSYFGAIRAAVAYGAGIATSLDLHRFDLRAALHLSLPVDQENERAANEELCLLLRQGVPLRSSYSHPPLPDQGIS